VRWNRFQQVVNESGKMPKFDFTPKVFFKVMRWEVYVVFASLCMGLMLPSLMKKNYELKGYTKDGQPSNNPNYPSHN
jgi:hypothetical protein